MNKDQRRRFVVPAAVVGGLVLFLLVTVDDWSRDFITNEAEIAADSGDPTLRPLSTRRSTEEMIAATRGAAHRIPSWSFVGQVTDGNTTRLIFVVTNRILRLKDDVIIRIVDEGGKRTLTGESRSRIGWGDLGKNPRNLRRFLTELRDVLEGAVRQPVGRRKAAGR